MVVFSSVFLFFIFPIKSLLFCLRKSEESVCNQHEGLEALDVPVHSSIMNLLHLMFRSGLEIFLSSLTVDPEMSINQ